MERLKVGICGASGKMGKALIKAVINNVNLELAGALEYAESQNLGKDAGETAGCGNIGIKITSDPKDFFSKVDEKLIKSLNKYIEKETALY